MEKKLSTKLAVAATGVVALAGIAIASPAIAATSSDTGSTTSTAPTFGKGGKGHGMRGDMDKNATPQTVTVNVPADGGSYVLVVTEAAPAATTTPTTTPAGLPHSKVVAITGTGSQTVTLPRLHTGKFTVQLVKLNGTVVNGEIGTDGKLVAPITIG